MWASMSGVGGRKVRKKSRSLFEKRKEKKASQVNKNKV